MCWVSRETSRILNDQVDLPSTTTSTDSSHMTFDAQPLIDPFDQADAGANSTTDGVAKGSEDASGK